jgi:hypothetical protein
LRLAATPGVDYCLGALSSPTFPPGQRGKYFGYAVLIAAGLLALLISFNRQYLFHTQLYEHSDQGLDSLSVLRAERFHEIHGAFSRWDLHHPGPALFYLFSWTEELFDHALRWMPTPYNAQVLASMILCSSLFAGAVCVAARWVQSRFFLPLALLLATFHFVAVDPHYCLMSTWPAHTMPMIFLALMIAAASVAAGQGDDLPLLVLAGGFAVHSNLAQPLFVVPLATLGYLGLGVASWRAGRAARVANAAAPAARVVPAQAVSMAPWRRFPRAHVFAAIILGAFLLPLAADLCLGQKSNLLRIFRNLPRDPAKHHPLLVCIGYFLRFSIYRPSLPVQEFAFVGHPTPQSLERFCFDHLKMTLLWVGAFLSPVPALAWGRIWRTVPVAAADEPVAASRRRRWRFVGWLYVIWAVSVALTLYWVHLIEIELSYYHAWFSYSIWFVLALIAAVALSDLLETCARRFGQGSPRRWVAGVCLGSVLLMAADIFLHQAKFRETLFNNQEAAQQGATIKQALADQAGGSRTKVLSFSMLGSGPGGGMAAMLERLGYNARVPPEWLNAFGSNHAPPDLLDGLPWNADGSAPFDVWRIVPAKLNPAAAASRPLAEFFALVLTHPEIDPANGFDITFAGARPNYGDFVVTGWTMDITGEPFVWSEGKLGLLAFRPKPVAAGESVEVVFDCYPFLGPGVVDMQRVRVGLNGVELGTLRFDNNAHGPETLRRVLIPGALWNKLPVEMLTLRFEDANSPKALHQSDDARLLALATRKITFRTVDTPAVP